MKKIYNYLFPVFLSLFVAVACDENNDEIVPMSYTDPVASVATINPVEGYVGDEFTISGADFGVRTEHVKVYIGSQEAEIVSCGDKSIVARVPESATNGNISVEVYQQRVESELGYRVLGKPGVSSVTPSYGFPGEEIVFKGQEFASSDASYTLTFGSEEKARIVEIPTDKEFKAVIPESAVSGILSLVIGTQAIDLASYPFSVLKHATLDTPKEGEPVPSGFAGSAFTITGTNLVQELLDKSVEGLNPLKVSFAKTGEEPVFAEIDTDKLTDKSITLTVPASLGAGDYTITVTTPFETIGTQLKYTVLPMPEVTGLSIAAGYINAEVTIKGKNFGTKVENIQVLFGETMCDNVRLDDKGNIVVNVPKGSPTGQNVIKLTIWGADIEMGGYSAFEVWETPEITSVATQYIYPYGTLVKAGEEVTFAGHGFGTDKENVTVTFEGVSAPVEIKTITTTAISVDVPQGFNGGKVKMIFGGINEPVESGELSLFPEDGDIAQYVLKNYKSTFEPDGGTYKGNEWAIAKDWTVENSLLTDGGANAPVSLQYTDRNNDRSKTVLALQTDWGFPVTKNNGKIYQTTTLPEGKYKLTAHVTECSFADNNVYITVCAGSSIAEIESISEAIGSVKVVNQNPGEYPVEFTLDKSTELSIGFVATFTAKQRYVKVQSFKLELVK